jgi:voltage-gated potassium channel Kch
VSDNGNWLGRRRAAVVLDSDGLPGRSVEISEFVFESGPVSSRVKGRAIATAEGPPDLMSTTGYLDVRSGERSATYRLVGAMSRMRSGRTVLDCTGFRQTDAAEFPVSTWIRLTVDETTAVVYVQRTRLPSDGQ